jgi:hypothetical protein
MQTNAEDDIPTASTKPNYSPGARAPPRHGRPRRRDDRERGSARSASGTPTLARATIDLDHKVNRAEMEVGRTVPAHSRAAAADGLGPPVPDALALKMVTDLERIGDLAVNICERAIDLQRRDAASRASTHSRSMAGVAQGDGAGCHRCVRATTTPSCAQRVIDRDDEVDELYHVYFRDVLAVMVVGAPRTWSEAFTFSPSRSGSNASGITRRTSRRSSSSWSRARTSATLGKLDP